MRHAGLAILGTMGLLALPARASDDDPHQWLERMSESLSSRNYTGVFTHSTRRQSETMRIVHRVGKGVSTERLVSLDGSGREIVRTAEEVHVYLPDRRVVLVEPRSGDGSLVEALPEPGPELDALYELQIRDGHKLLGRDVRVLDIRPRDAFRYGYRLWLDEETAMPLRTVVVDGAGRPVELINFTQLEMPKRIEARATEPTIDASGFQWVRNVRRPHAPPPAAGRLAPHEAAARISPRRKPHAGRARSGVPGAAPDLFRRVCVDLRVHRARPAGGARAAGVLERGFGQRLLDAGPGARGHGRGRGAPRDGAGYREVRGAGAGAGDGPVRPRVPGRSRGKCRGGVAPALTRGKGRPAADATQSADRRRRPASRGVPA